jgi:hypothetical protein
MTHEREITEPVDLCTPDGASLNPAARGWSRRPLHRANLEGQHGRNKRWDYWAILADDVVVSAVYANIDYLAFADVWWADLSTGESGGGATGGRGDDFPLPEVPGERPLIARGDGFDLSIVDGSAGTRLRAEWVGATGEAGSFEIDVALPVGHESLNVVIPWSDDTFNFTSKHQARPAVGELRVGDRRWAIGGPGRDAWGVLDVGRGRWPAQVQWNWGGGAGRCGPHVVGLQVGGKWTEGTGFTENGLIVDGRLTKLGTELRWTYDWERPLEPWHIEDPGGQLDAVLSPRFDKHTELNGDGEGSETHQVFGTWSGTLRTDEGIRLDFTGLQGFAEEARQRW